MKSLTDYNVNQYLRSKEGQEILGIRISDEMAPFCHRAIKLEPDEILRINDVRNFQKMRWPMLPQKAIELIIFKENKMF